MNCTAEGYKDKECVIPTKGFNVPCTDCPTKEKAQLFIDTPESKKNIKWANTEKEILACAGINVNRI
jgi:hypothetical protein